MRSFVVLFAIVSMVVFVKAAELTQEQKDRVKANHDKCLSETGVDVEIVKKAKNEEFSDDAKLKSYTLCLSKASGFQDANGKINIDVIRKKVSTVVTDPAALEKLIQQCAVEKATPEDTAVDTFKCYHQNTPTHVSVF